MPIQLPKNPSLNQPAANNPPSPSTLQNMQEPKGAVPTLVPHHAPPSENPPPPPPPPNQAETEPGQPPPPPPPEKESDSAVSIHKDPVKISSFPFKKVLFSLLLILLLGALAGGGIFAYNYFLNNPQKVLAEGLENLTQADSLTMDFSLPESEDFTDLTATWDYHKDVQKLSKISAKISGLENDPDHNLDMLLVFNEEELFLAVSYSKTEDLENQLKAIMPEITQFRTYQMVKPLLKGIGWLHIKIPASSLLGDSGKEEMQIITEELSALQEKFIKSVIIRSYERSYAEGGQNYEQIILGFDKAALLDLVESLKELNLNLTLSDVNSLKEIIEEVDNWDSDLITILIEKKTKNIYSISLSLPEIPEGAIEREIQKKIQGDENLGPFSGFLPENIGGFLGEKKAEELLEISKVTFSNYSTASVVEQPTNFTEAEGILAVAQQESMAFMQLFLGQMQNPELFPSFESNGTTSFPPSDQSSLLPYKFQSSGEKHLEEGIAAHITNAWEEDGVMKIKVILANRSGFEQLVGSYLVKFDMYSQTLRADIIQPAPPLTTEDTALSFGQEREFELSFIKLPDPPYRWIYAPLNGGTPIELGAYIQTP